MFGLSPPAPNDPAGEIFYLGEAADRRCRKALFGKDRFSESG